MQLNKLLSVCLIIAMTCTLFVGCGKSLEGPDITLITDKGSIDDKSFNQATWEGVVEFATKHEIKHQYIKPEAETNYGYLSAIDQAVESGAKVVVASGFLFEVAVYEAQAKYPDIKFIIVDGAPHTADYVTYETNSNVASIMYAEQESGFLAGYAAVKDGMTKLGFMGGMSVPAVRAFGYGFLQGAEIAAEELDLADGSVSVLYHYTGDFAESDANKATAKAMYQKGTEVIFACGGSVGKSVMSAAAEAGAKVIGVDVDQRYDSTTVITSATKGLGASVIAVLDSIYKTNSWSTYAGKTTYFSAKNDGVSLPTIVIGDEKADAFDRFTTFKKADYDAILAKLVSGEIVPIRYITIADSNGYATSEELNTGLKLTKLKIVVD